MGDYLEKPMSNGVFYTFLGALIVALVLLAVIGSEPYVRGDEMLEEYKSNCDKVGGIILEKKRWMGTEYLCVEDWNKLRSEKMRKTNFVLFEQINSPIEAFFRVKSILLKNLRAKKN